MEMNFLKVFFYRFFRQFDFDFEGEELVMDKVN